MKNKIAVTIAALLLSVSSFAQTSWEIGNPTATDVTATLSANGTILTISGTGAMQDFASDSVRPWHSIRMNIETVIIEDGVTTIGGWAFYQLYNLDSINICDNITSIGHAAFGGCPNFVGAFPTIPASVTYISSSAFSGMSKLTSFSVDNNNSEYSSSVDGVLFNKNQTSLVKYPEGKTGNTYIIPGTVTNIGENAFSRTSLTSVTIPNSVTNIGEHAFFYCTGLTSVTIPNNVTSIGATAFGGTNLDTVYVLANTPPAVYSSPPSFVSFEASTKVIVPVGTAGLYKNSPWNGWDIIGYFQITVKAATNKGTAGSVQSPGYGLRGDKFLLSNATPSAYYEWTGFWRGLTTNCGPIQAYVLTNPMTLSSCDMDVFPDYQPINYSIKYINTGGTNSTDTITNYYNVEYSTITLPGNPKGDALFAAWSRDDYRFMGWFSNSGLSGAPVTVVKPGPNPSDSHANLMFWAKWSRIYTIHYNSNGGNEFFAEHKFVAEDIEITPYILPSPTRLHHEFKGWYAKADEDDDMYSVGPITEISTVGDRNLKAKWDRLYNIHYEQNGGSGATDTIYREESGIIYLPTADQMTKVGCTFEGWYADTSHVRTITRVLYLAAGSTGDTLFWAKWTPITYSIEYHNVIGATMPDVNRTEFDITTPTFRVEDPTMAGYNFVGWFKNVALTDPTTFTDKEFFQGSGPYPAAADRTIHFYAKWDRIYHIAYDLNDSPARPVTNAANLDLQYDASDLPLTLVNAERMGYEFGGWYADPGTSITKVLSLVNGSAGDTALWAKWTLIPYDIIYNQNGGSGATNGQYNIDSLTITLPDAAKMHKAGYTFGGWYDNVALTGAT
ncbi:hypothetical protein SAMD00024442_147_1, partial [Candidatus Symbiothrix dinenymphae]